MIDLQTPTPGFPDAGIAARRCISQPRRHRPARFLLKPMDMLLLTPARIALTLTATVALPVAHAQTTPPAAEPSPPAPEQEEDDGPWRLTSALGLPEWLRISGSFRLRVEGIDGQFRAPTFLDNSDSYWVMRTRLKGEVDVGPLTGVLELMDARHFGAGQGSVINRTVVNPIDFLQGHIVARLGPVGELKVGRFVQDYGSRRLVASNRFRNTINAFDGARWDWESEGGVELSAFWALPVFRRPFSRQDLLDNRPELDDQDKDVQFYGGFIGIPATEKIDVEVYAFLLDQRAISALRTDIATPGLRIYRAPERGALDYQGEGAVQFGESSLLLGGTDLDHWAWFGHASIGYTFDAAWSPRIRLAYDYASGDRDPNDNENNRFNTLFGARRFEYGPTGIYGAVARANLSSPEVRLEVRPDKKWQGMAAFRGVWLAAARDFWVPAGVRDPTGQSGTHVGEQIEARIRYDVLPKSLRLEVGAAYLFAGSFPKQAPNGRGENTAYGYAQMAWTF